MKVIFCLAHHAVRRTVAIAESEPSGNFLIVTSNRDVIEMFLQLYPAERLCFINQPLLISRNPLRVAWSIIVVQWEKHVAWNKLKYCVDGQVYFLDWAFCDMEFWLLRRLARANQVYYAPSIQVASVPWRTPKALLGVAIRWLAYFIVFSPRRASHLHCYTLTPRLLRKIGAQELVLVEEVAAAEDAIVRSLPPGLAAARIMMLPAPQVGTALDPQEYGLKIDSVIEALDEECGLQVVAVKAHPRFPNYHAREASLQRVPSFIDAQLLFTVFQVYIGYSSAVLFQAAQAGKTAISLMYLIESMRPEAIAEWREYLDSHTSGKIHYPRQVSEVRELVRRSLRETGGST